MKTKSSVMAGVLIGVICLFMSVTFTSCNKLVTVDAPGNQIQSEAVFTSEQTATSAVVGIFDNMASGNPTVFNGGLSVYNGVSADEIIPTAPTSDIADLYANSIATTNGINKSFWLWLYGYIYQANAALEGLKNASISASANRQLTGEAKFARALCFFYLTNLYGDVPLTLSTDYRQNQSMPRTLKATVTKQVIEDLVSAQNLLTAAYPTTGKVRPNKWTATALLARVYLFQKDWQNALSNADAIINSGVYSMPPSLSAVFLANSSEAIWQLMPTVTSSNTYEGGIFIPGTATTIPAYTINPYLLNTFDAKDKRKTIWTKMATVNGNSYTYPYKYIVKSGTAVSEYNMVFRLAEQYLIRAETKAQLNDISGAAADLNIIRKRAGTDTLTYSTSQSDCLSAIYKERQLELFAEWGHRWFDLIRTSRIDAILSVEKAGWKSTAALFPIPNSELLSNPFLTPNPGY